MNRVDPKAWVEGLGISEAAVALYQQSDVIDLHIDTFIWRRVFGYDLNKAHGTGLLDARFYGQADLPRVLSAGLTGAHWVVTTNPLRTRRGKRDTFFANLDALSAQLAQSGAVDIVTNVAGYRAARARGKHAAFLAVQGGNALEHDLTDFERLADGRLLRVTLVHFTRSRIGAAALPPLLVHGPRQLTAFGADFVRALNQQRIFVDLAHISREGFADVLRVHDQSQPLLITHTGCDAVHPHWRNATDDQLRAVAATGGVIGVMFQCQFLGEGHVRAERVVDHLQHIITLVGEDYAALGSDFDGAIIPPRDLKSVLELPRLVDIMLRRGFEERVIRKVLGQNFLRALTLLRG
jgi:membrane dipeptidase